MITAKGNVVQEVAENEKKKILNSNLMQPRKNM